MTARTAKQSSVVDAPARPPDRPAPPSVRPAAGRTLRRRQSLPSGRAVVGGFLVALAALGVFVAWSQATAGPTESYVVAARDLPIGTRIEAGDLVLVPMSLPARISAFTDPASLVGATVVGPVRENELVQAGDVVDKRGATDELEVSFAIDASRALAGALAEGEIVDVAATFGSGGDTYTSAVVKGARVLRTSQRGGALSDGRTVTVTLAVKSRAEALALTHAASAGEITLVRTTGVDLSADATDTYRAPAASEEDAGG